MSRGRWGRAGVRLTEREQRTIELRAGLRRLRDQQAHDTARRKWAAGELVPARITSALDLHELYGPEVDAACGVAEPDVDRWEAGELYPTWEQLLALAKITPRVTLLYFFIPVGKPMRTTLQFHLPGVSMEDEEPVARFKPEAFTAAPTPFQDTLW